MDEELARLQRAVEKAERRVADAYFWAVHDSYAVVHHKPGISMGEYEDILRRKDTSLQVESMAQAALKRAKAELRAEINRRNDECNK